MCITFKCEMHFGEYMTIVLLVDKDGKNIEESQRKKRQLFKYKEDGWWFTYNNEKYVINTIIPIRTTLYGQLALIECDPHNKPTQRLRLF